jgi:hypothetical protein
MDLCAGRSAMVSKQPVGRHGQLSAVTSRKSSSVLSAEKDSSRLGCRQTGQNPLFGLETVCR